MSEIFLFLFTISAIIYWWFGAQSREQAIVEAKRLCALDGLQFLDQTVELHKQSLTRNNQGSVCYSRLFIFQFAMTGAQRYKGRVLMAGGRVAKSELDAYHVESEDLH